MDRINTWADWEEAKKAEPETEAEAALIAACQAGRACKRGTRPTTATDATRIRAPLLAYLIRGGCDACPTTERGIWLEGAFVTGQLDITGATAKGRTVLDHCTFEATIKADDSHLAMLSLDGSAVPGLDLERAKVTGGVFLGEGFHAQGEVRLSGATIDGALSCIGGRFENAGEYALFAQGAKVTGPVFLRDGFHAKGVVSLAAATIEGQFDCSGGRFENAGRIALNATGAKVAGDVFLSYGFHAQGEVRLSGATIDGALSCIGGRFENAGKWALTAQRMKVTQSFFFREGAQADGLIVLSAAHVGDLVDDLACWPEGPDQLNLDGFTYDRIAGGAPTDAARRLPWLARGSVWNGEFHPQALSAAGQGAARDGA